jgi:SAM-dependent methyltransferase
MSDILTLTRNRAPTEHATRHGTSALGAFAATLQYPWHGDAAWDLYKPTIAAAVRQFGATRLLEIGGGRDPLFAAEEAEALGVTQTLNDIDPTELARAPRACATLCFDVSANPGTIGAPLESFDLIYSRMVMEHVRDAAGAWRTKAALLRKGGLAVAFFPTLYYPPYVLNALIPERLSSAIVRALYKDRAADGDDPKFPAHYDWCISSRRRLEPMLAKAGFSEMHVQPFWGSSYFRGVSLLHRMDQTLARMAAGLNWRALTSYAIVLARR